MSDRLPPDTDSTTRPLDGGELPGDAHSLAALHNKLRDQELKLQDLESRVRWVEIQVAVQRRGHPTDHEAS